MALSFPGRVAGGRAAHDGSAGTAGDGRGTDRHASGQRATAHPGARQAAGGHRRGRHRPPGRPCTNSCRRWSTSFWPPASRKTASRCSWRPARTVRRCSATWSARSARRSPERLKIVYHNPYDNLTDLGHTSSGVPISINRSYLACDLRISIGGITPHDFAGFGGGYKTVTVGLSGIRALYETHIKRIAEFDAGVARIDGNRFQEYVQEIGAKVGIDFAINVVMTARRGIADLYAGDPDAVFRSACASARERYATPATGGYDVAVLNAYPKDIDWVQSMMALNVGFFGNETLVAEGGTVVLTTPAIDGGTLHYLGAEGMEGYARPGAEAMQGRRLIICSPGLNRHDVRTYFPPGAVSPRDLG